MRTITRALSKIPSGAARWRGLLLSGGATSPRRRRKIAAMDGAGGRLRSATDLNRSGRRRRRRRRRPFTDAARVAERGREKLSFCFFLTFATEGTGECARKVRTEHFPHHRAIRGVNLPQVSISRDRKGAYACENGTLLRRPTSCTPTSPAGSDASLAPRGANPKWTPAVCREDDATEPTPPPQRPRLVGTK